MQLMTENYNQSSDTGNCKNQYLSVFQVWMFYTQLPNTQNAMLKRQVSKRTWDYVNPLYNKKKMVQNKSMKCSWTLNQQPKETIMILKCFSSLAQLL